MKTNQERTLQDGISALVWAAGTNSRDHGFHEDWPDGDDFHNQADYRRQESLAITEKLALIHEEVSEALGEIRSGHEATEVYYTSRIGAPYPEQIHNEDGKPLRKPEGFGIELADAMIRIADLAYLTGIDLGAHIIEKAQYNATREHKHGRKF
jgi:NTP pyrophosphatase (non-canonical NTP hydrolase)